MESKMMGDSRDLEQAAGVKVLTVDEAIAHLIELADSWECGAKMEDAIVAAYQPELDAFSNRYKDKDEPHDIRLIRAVLDARSNRDRFRKDAAALRAVLANADTADRQPSPREAK